MSKTILIVDDEQTLAQIIEQILRKEGYSAHCVYRGKDAVDYVKQSATELVLLDVHLPDMNGLEVLKEIKKSQKSINVIMMSGEGTISVAVQAMQFGAYDFIEKPFEAAGLKIKVAHVFERQDLERQVIDLKRELGEKYKLKSLLGESPVMKKIFSDIEIAAKSNANVLVMGESGTGKELIARAIHFNSARKENRFVAVDCGAIPGTLLESELYGHEKGAFTGAISTKIGKFEQAHGGTLFLDEIGDMPLDQQVKLLRVLQEREIQRIGGGQPIPIDIRLVCATNRDLKTLIKENKFREDLFFRIHVFPVMLPPLRERREDIPVLLAYFLKKFAYEKPPLKIDGAALQKLTEYDWPGNVRELENFAERMSLIKGENSILQEEDVKDLGAMPQGTEKSVSPQTMEDAEKGMLESALKRTKGNISKASELLQISRDTFYRKLKKYNIPQ